MKQFAIIVAGGSGTRMKSDVPKQFILLNGKPVLFHTLERFHKFDPSIKIILVLPEKHFSYWKKLCDKFNFTLPYSIVPGGKERFFSVKNGLELIHSKSVVAIHDGVRPLVDEITIKRCFDTAKKMGNAIPVIPVDSSMRKKKKNGSIAINRNDYYIVQTPQCFYSEIIKKAYNQKYSKEFTDDASVVEKYGEKINLVDGIRENIKITSQMDLRIAEVLQDFLRKDNF